MPFQKKGDAINIFIIVEYDGNCQHVSPHPLDVKEVDQTLEEHFVLL